MRPYERVARTLWRDHDMRGYNFLHAAIGLAQMDRLDEFTAKRRANAAYLKRRNAGVP